MPNPTPKIANALSLEKRPRDEVKKHNSAIHVSGTLSLIERKIVNVLLLNAFDKLTTAKQHTIPVSLLCALVGWEKSSNTAALKKALRTIATTAIEFDLFRKGGESTWDTTAIVAHAGIAGGICTYEYSTFLAEKLANPEMYSIIDMRVQREFKGNYSLSLYENCLRFRGTNGGSTGWWPVDTWRKVLGADAALYDEFKFLSGKVLKPAVAEINKVSDLVVEPEYKRNGRSVAEIRFIVKDNPQRSLLDVAAAGSIGTPESEVVQTLIDIGAGRALALSVVATEGTERALELARYVGSKVENGEITESVGGYIQSLVAKKAIVTKPRKPPKSPSPAPVCDSSIGVAKASKSVSARLTEAERAVLLERYIHETGACYLPEKMKFADVEHMVGHRAYVIEHTPEVLIARGVKG